MIYIFKKSNEEVMDRSKGNPARGMGDENKGGRKRVQGGND